MNSKIDNEQPLGNVPSGSSVSRVQIIQMLNVERRSLALMTHPSCTGGGGTAQRPYSSFACSNDGSISASGRAPSNAISVKIKSESSDGAVGGGAFVAQWTHDFGACSCDGVSSSSQQLCVCLSEVFSFACSSASQQEADSTPVAAFAKASTWQQHSGSQRATAAVMRMRFNPNIVQ